MANPDTRSPADAPTSPGTNQPGSGPAVRAGVRTNPRSKLRRRAAPLAKIGMAVFAVGLIAIFADMILFASGSRDLPLWVNLTAMLAPVGLGLGLIGVLVENRRSSPAIARRNAG